MFKTIAEAGENDSGKRADRVFRRVLPGTALGIIYREIRKGRLRINGKKTLPDIRIEQGDRIDIHISLLEEGGKLPYSSRSIMHSAPADQDADYSDQMPQIVFEDKDILAFNKLRGMPVHSISGKSNTEITLETLAGYYLSGRISKSLTFKPGPLNRLDRNTSGIVFFGKTVAGARNFTQLQKERKFVKTYIGLVDGVLENIHEWSSYLMHDYEGKKSVQTDQSTGKFAATKAIPLIAENNRTIALFEIKTGRYHQIRKQAAINRHPLTGDVKYGSLWKDKGQYLLHCFAVEAENSGSVSAGFSRITAPPPEEFYSALCLFFRTDTIHEIRKNISLLI